MPLNCLLKDLFTISCFYQSIDCLKIVAMTTLGGILIFLNFFCLQVKVSTFFNIDDRRKAEGFSILWCMQVQEEWITILLSEYLNHLWFGDIQLQSNRILHKWVGIKTDESFFFSNMDYSYLFISMSSCHCSRNTQLQDISYGLITN